MKILAIRGHNLASLGGEFNVDFRQEPLASASVYLISGPTGAGKSTLLDALCLALYGTCPRLTGAFGHFVDVGGEKPLLGDNPLSLVRRGAVQAGAGAEFIGQDGRHYRCEWSASRKRDKADQGFRGVEQTLWDVAADQQIGRTLSETRQEIVARVGLNFDQFSRAVLLAQNQFATFLKAKPADRAQLLEQLTHTGIYRRLSILAHERARAVREALQQAQARLSERAVLDDAERAALDAQQGTLTASLAQADLDLDALRAAAAWLQAEQTLQQSTAMAEQQYQAAIATDAAAEPRRSELTQIERSQSARPLLAELARAGAARLSAAAALKQASGQVHAAAQALAAQRQATTAAEAAAVAAQAGRRDAAPALQQARRLDIELSSAAAECAQANSALATVAASLAGHRRQLADLQREQTAWLGRQQQAAGKSHALAAIGHLVEQWPLWQSWLQQWAGHLATWQQARIDLRAATRALEQTTGHYGDLAGQLTLLAERQEQANRALTAAEQAAAAFEPTAIGQQRDQAVARLADLQAAQLAGERARDSLAERTMTLRRFTEYSQVRDEAGAALPAAEMLEQRLRGEQDGAEKQWQLAQTALSVNAETMRSQLQDGAACPVCGSLEHPWAEHSGFATVLRAQQQAVEATRKALRNAQMECDRLRTRLRSSGEEADTWERRLSAAAAQDEAAQQARLAAMAQCGLAADTPAATVAHLLHELDQQRRQLDQQWQAAEAARQTLDQARQQQQGLQRELEQARERLRHADEQQRAEQTRRQDAEHRQHAAELLLQAARQQLDQALGEGAGADWTSDPAAFVQQLSQHRSDWQAAQSLLREAEQKLAALAEDLARVGEAVNQTAEAHQQCAAGLAERRRTLEQLQQQRQGLFAGQPVDPVEAALQLAETQAQQHWMHCRDQLEAAEKASAAAQATAASAAAAVSIADAAEVAAQSAWAQWLAEVGGAEADWRTRLAASPDWITTERTALQQLQQQCAERLVLWQDHRQRLEDHQAQRLTLLDAAEVAEQIAALQQERAQRQQQLADTRARIQLDEQARSRSQQEQAQVAELQTEAAIWEDLRSVIGSSDGARFSRFAQQLTMASLLDYANAHLANFAPRYRLAALDSDGLDFHIIDGDMADETRTIHSLSGGESFLVSLALALGLASLSADRVRIESLFIDEGFGSLDSDTLQVAVAALDKLQASGRTVGIISHVTELATQITVQIQVRRVGHGASHVVVVRGADDASLL